MIIDFHTHMFPDKIAKGTLDFLEGICKVTPYTNGTYEGLKRPAKGRELISLWRCRQ